MRSIQKKRVVSKSEAQIILQVRQYFESEKLDPSKVNVNQVLARTAEATGVHRNFLTRISNQEDVDNWPHQDGAKLKYNTQMNVPEKFEALVRSVIRDLFLEKKKVPTLDLILEKLQELKVQDVDHLNLFENENMPPEDSKIWLWGRTTLFKFMKSIGFAFDDHVSPYEHKKRPDDIQLMRDNYLEWIQNYRAEGYNIYYQDETWVFKNIACRKVWQDKVGNSTQGTFNVPSGKGERSILSHVASQETGLLNNCLLLFRGAKSNKSEDYHTEMNWDVFSHWCENVVFPEILKTNKKSVIVLDHATYHTKLDDDDRWPVTSWNKARLSEAILRWGPMENEKD